MSRHRVLHVPNTLHRTCGSASLPLGCVSDLSRQRTSWSATRNLADPNLNHDMRPEIVADGSPLFGPAAARANVANVDGAATELPRRWKVRANPELFGQHARTRLVVPANSRRLRADRCPLGLRRRTDQAWRSRWQALLSCTARGGQGADGDVPLANGVENTFRIAGSCGPG